MSYLLNNCTTPKKKISTKETAGNTTVPLYQFNKKIKHEAVQIWKTVMKLVPFEQKTGNIK